MSLADVSALVGDALPHLRRSADDVDRLAYARDLWPRHHIGVRDGRLPTTLPGVVVWPRSTEDVAAVVALAAREGVPLVPFGAGSGVCGGVLPDARAIVLDLKHLTAARITGDDGRILEVGAGALGFTLEEDLQRKGKTLGHFPSSILCSTVGGWIAARSAGQCSGLYGKIEDMVLSLECVVGRGEVVHFSRRVRGPDMTPLLIGSEGVLGVVTSARLRLCDQPSERAFASYAFPSLEAGWETMRRLFQEGLRPAVARLYDPFDSFLARMGKVRGSSTKQGDPKASKVSATPGYGAAVLRTILKSPATLNGLVDAIGSRAFGGALLVLVFEGAAGTATDDAARAHALAVAGEGKPLGEAPARRWLEHRYGVSYRQAPMIRAGTFTDTMEVAAPWSRLGALYEGVRRALGNRVFVMAHLSHAYPDGCSIYFTFAGAAPSGPEAEALYDRTWQVALDAAIAAGGTLSHHHGVGRSKAPKLGAELGAGVDVIHALRGVLDPAGIMNPGNLLPRESPVRSPHARPARPALDLRSRLVHAPGDATLAEIERTARDVGLSLGLDESAVSLATTVDAWLAAGTPGAPLPFADPADHALAGFSARLASGTELVVRPAPRRAVGPDLLALFHGTDGRVGHVTSAWLRLVGEARPRALPFTWGGDPPLEGSERAHVERLLDAAAATR